MKKGIVYLVGAGPGDPGLITVKGLECIRRADVIVHDRLASPQLLQEARPDAEKIYVGKASSRHAMRQDDINRLLVDLASQGKTVCRLKGGDPYVFGRGGEEAETLVEAGIPFQEVPGVTSAIAAPAYAGIPVTHRDFTSGVAIFTGHEDPNKTESSIAWDKIATGVGTLVFVMGMENLPRIVEKLQANGRAPQTPVGLVRWGTLPRQQVLTGTLADIVDKAREASFSAPVIIIVGEVVTLRERLRWFDNRPLSGKRVLVTRTREQARHLSALLREQGAEPVECPTIKIEPLEDSAALDHALSSLSGYDWVVFTSVHGVRSVLDRLRSLGQDPAVLGASKLAAIGPSTAKELTNSGLSVAYQPKEYVAEAIVEGLDPVSGKRILLPRADIAREALAIGLRDRGALVDEVDAYRTVPAASEAELVRRLLASGEIDVVTFTSSSTVRSFVALLEQGMSNEEQGTGTRERALSLLEGVKVACIGPITSKTARELGLQVDIEASEYTIPGLVEALVEAYGKDLDEGSLG
ncbi:MAG: uroporphyrinogen-III C-methyltransferase [Dehalococcoidia bacterium]|nr:uroporphyrinogen-III C-methyltransferase [Dehalococcoidia bacterium]